MNKYETIENAEITPKEKEQIALETAQSMREMDKLQINTEATLTEATEYLDTQEFPMNEEKISVLQSIGETFHKSKLLKAAALAVTLASAQGTKSAFAENNNLIPQNSHQLNVDASNFNNPGTIRLKNMNRSRLLGSIQPEQLSINGKNVLPGQISHFSRNTLPNASINGGPAYEIAPGIYGDENTVYKQTSDGGTVLMGGISIE